MGSREIKGESVISRKGKVIAMKQNKLFKKLWVFMLVLSFLATQFATVQAAAKTNKETISLNKSVYTLKKGKTVKLKAVLNKAAKRKGVKWSSSNRKVATVSKNGKVTAKRKGKAAITATVKGTSVKARCKITVGTPVSKMTLNRRSLTLKTGQSFSLKTSISPKKASVKKVNYKSSNKRVASVSKKGVIQAVSAGTVKITATAADGSGKRAVCMVKVEEPETANETTKPEETPKPQGGKLLVAYFSWSGTSERIAKNIITQTGADSFRIERETPYSDDYNTVAYGEAKDEADSNARPPLKNPLESVAAYDKIVLCYPIWWHTAPMTVGTFLETYDLTGKTIYPISQSASMDVSQYNQSVEFIKECAKGAVVDDGLFTKDNAVIQSYVAETVLPVKQPAEQNPSSVSHIVSYADVPLLSLNNGVPFCGGDGADQGARFRGQVFQSSI
jgi:flavodoxin